MNVSSKTLEGTRLLAANVGSSSVRIAGFTADRAGALLETLPQRVLPPGDAIALDGFQPDYAVHRIVRGLKTDVWCEPLSENIKAEIESASLLAPVHDRAALAFVERVRAQVPNARHLVAYDSAFHATISAARSTYAIPQSWRDLGIRRIGYHGLSHADAAARLTAAGIERGLCAHLGSGCSIAAIVDGRSVATTMGFTPLDGVVMATRSGSIDPEAVLYLLRRGVPLEEVAEGLNARSGLLALGGDRDVRVLLAREAGGDACAHVALEIFVESVAQAFGQMAVAAGGIDALSFAGGIGYGSSQLRERICHRLAWLGIALDASANAAASGDSCLISAPNAIPAWCFDVHEERVMAERALAYLSTVERALNHAWDQSSP